jgi:hypothetical protein
MARQRDPAHVALPKIEIDEPRQVRLSLRGRLCQDLEAYRAAYKEAYGMEVELEALIPHMLETYIQSDRSFRSWRTGRQQQAAAE